MLQSEMIFWTLLQAGLWGREPKEITEKISKGQWLEIGSTAKKQTVLTLIFDGILMLPKLLQPEEDIRRQWMLYAIKIEQIHRKQNHVLAELAKRFEDEKLKVMLLKGESNAIFYDNPLRRQCGDIDLFVGRKNYQRACDLVRQWKIADEGTEWENNKHLEFKWDKVPIEIHRIVATPFSKKFSMIMIPWGEDVLNDTKEQFIPKDESTSVYMAPPEFNPIYLFYHLLNHFLTRGVGLRQLCDFARYLHVNAKTINRNRLKKDLQLLGLFLPWKAFGYLLVHQIGLPQDEFPFYDVKMKRKSARIWTLIEEEGNFGKYSQLMRHRPQGYVKGKLYSFSERTRKYLFLLNLFPALTSHYLWHFIIGGTLHVFLDKQNKSTHL